MIAIIDYDTGNLRSVANALARLDAEYVVTADHAVIRNADQVILPGVGEASSAMQKLRDRGLDVLIPTLTQPVLGICIGMQLMCRHSQEGDARCLGIFDTDVRLLESADPQLKVPHMGWDSVEVLSTSDKVLSTSDEEPSTGTPFRGLGGLGSAYFYYVHSYAAGICPDTVAITDYCRPFSAILKHDNFTGMQFHPEKSGAAGAQLLNSWLTT